MSKPGEHYKFQWAEIDRLTRELNFMRRWGISELDPSFRALNRARGAAFGKLGLAKPRVSTLIVRGFGLSPGELKLFADAELGWLVEAKASPKSPPVFKYVGDDIAEKIVKEELTHEEFITLAAPDDYIGE